MISTTQEDSTTTWFDSSDLARKFRRGRRREGWALVGAGGFLGIIAIIIIAIPNRFGGPIFYILAIVLFAVAVLMLALGYRGISMGGYLAGVGIDDKGLHLRFLDGPERLAGWTGIHVELVFLDLPPNRLLGKEAAVAAASWMLWLEGRCIGDIQAAAVERISALARSHGLKVERTQGPWRAFRAADVLRISSR